MGSPYEDINGVPEAGAVKIVYGSAEGLTAAGNQFWHQDSPGILDRRLHSERTLSVRSHLAEPPG